MSEIQFDEDGGSRQSFKSRTILGAPSTPKMVQVLLKTGIIKDEKIAGYILITLSILCFVISIALFYITLFSNPSVKGLPPKLEAERQLKQYRLNSLKN